MIAMMHSIPDIEKVLLFGLQDLASVFYTELLQDIPNLQSHIFLSREKADGFRHGRIDLSAFVFSKESEFYLCGSGAMIEESIAKLTAQGFQKIYHEKF